MNPAAPSTTPPPRVPLAEDPRHSARPRKALLRALAITAAVAIAVSVASIQDAPPAAAASADATFGPDGTHYPSDTPDIRSDLSAYTVVDVAASGQAIRDALDALTVREIDKGAVIRVLPGRIADLSALDGYENTAKLKVLITARDGFQSVTGADWALRDVTGISLMRFDIDSIDVKGASHSSFAWLRVNENWVGLSASAGVPVRDVELIEVVEPDSTVKSSDSAQIKAYAPDVMGDVLVEGGYVAPSYYVDAAYGGSNPPRPHTDSLQIEGGGIDGRITVRDTVVFTSNNSAVIIGGVRNVAFEHAFIVGDTVGTQRYPFLAGGAGYPGAINGPGSLSAIQGSGGGDVDASDSTFIGSLQPVWDTVTDTRTNLADKTASKGGFTLDPTLSGMSAADLDAMSPRPTTARLVSIWDSVGPTTSPRPTPKPTPTPTPTTSPGPVVTDPETPVADVTDPTVAIVSPAPGAVVSGTTTATATASDDTTVTGVTFFAGGLEIGDGVRTGASTWSLTTDTAGLVGTGAITASATDAAGNTAVSDPVIVSAR